MISISWRSKVMHFFQQKLIHSVIANRPTQQKPIQKCPQNLTPIDPILFKRINHITAPGTIDLAINDYRSVAHIWSTMLRGFQPSNNCKTPPFY